MEKKEDKKVEQTLEELFERLDSVMERLEGEEVFLEESFQLYQEGMDILKICNTKIDTVEKKVQMLDKNGEKHEFE